MTEEFDDRLDRAARQLRTEIPPERDLWPGIEDAIAAPQRSRWTPMLAQAAAVVLLVGASSAVTWFVVSDDNAPVVNVTPELVFEQAAFGGNYHLGPGFQDARNSLRAELDVELAHEIEQIVKSSKPDEDSSEPIKTAIPYKVNDRVRIKEGTFENFEGDVEGIDEANGRITVVINIFNRSTPVELEHWQIESV
jgi:transcription antitermination factor NusG